MGRMRCLKGLGEWNKLNYSCIDLLGFFDSNNPKTDDHNNETSRQLNIYQNQSLSIQSNRRQLTSKFTSGVVNINLNSPGSNSDQKSILKSLKMEQQSDYKAKIAEMGAAACWGLGDWKKMEKYVEYLPENSYDKSLYKTVLELTLEPSQSSKESLQLIERTRDLLDIDLTSMASQSYDRSYQAIIEAQVLAELEEIITYRKSPGKRDWLRDTWWKRLQGCERSLEYWHRLLLVRSIVLPKEKDIKPWLKFSSMSQKSGNLVLAQNILTSLMASEEEQIQKNLINSSRDYELCKYAYFKYLYANGNKKEAFDKLKEFLIELKTQFNQLEQLQLFHQQQQINLGSMPIQVNITFF